MNFEVKNERNVTVGNKTFGSLDEAHTFIAANNGYSKGWYIDPIRENVNGSTGPSPEFLSE